MNIGFLTTSRSDFGIYLPLIKKIQHDKDLNYFIFCGGMHTSSKFGMSYKLIEDEYNFEISEKINSLIENDNSQGISESMGLTLLPETHLEVSVLCEKCN